jgi:hypothetical protein
MKILKTILLVVAAVGLSGCYITGITMENRVGDTISVYSHHTKTTAILRNGKTEEISHSSGPITITVTNGPTWQYTSLSWFDDRLAKDRYMKNHPILYKGTRGFLVDANGHIFALRPALIGWKHKHFREQQPDGYPLKPDKNGELPNPKVDLIN